MSKLELLTKYFGIGLISLGILRLQDGVTILSEVITGLSLASFFLILPDFVAVILNMPNDSKVRFILSRIYKRTSKVMTHLCYFFL
ncbi:hypothetical protein CN689_05495 [Peribacillus butanolivorans]|uniref:Uncharacterized protein n=1 Tax=Peribacillus butanolivorans TaxID=421767 RepID=A0AAX0S4Q8_9BACI|nr:hypothetical protein CN689_05495 [Peribacillus butanolivorans]